jgi:hypothetical protein
LRRVRSARWNTSWRTAPRDQTTEAVEQRGSAREQGEALRRVIALHPGVRLGVGAPRDIGDPHGVERVAEHGSDRDEQSAGTRGELEQLTHQDRHQHERRDALQAAAAIDHLERMLGAAQHHALARELAAERREQPVRSDRGRALETPDDLVAQRQRDPDAESEHERGQEQRARTGSAARRAAECERGGGQRQEQHVRRAGDRRPRKQRGCDGCERDRRRAVAPVGQGSQPLAPAPQEPSRDAEHEQRGELRGAEQPGLELVEGRRMQRGREQRAIGDRAEGDRESGRDAIYSAKIGLDHAAPPSRWITRT